MEWNTQEAGPSLSTSLNSMDDIQPRHHWTHKDSQEKSNSCSSFRQARKSANAAIIFEVKIPAHTNGAEAPHRMRERKTKEPAFIDEYEMSEQSAGMGHDCPMHEEVGTHVGGREMSGR